MKRSYVWTAIILCCIVVVSLAVLDNTRLWGQSASMQGDSAEASNGFIFQLELGGQPVAEYSECFGLGSSNEIQESVIETDSGVIVKEKTPGALEWSAITLRRSTPSDAQVWLWRKALEDGKLDETIRDGALVMFQAGYLQPIARWNFTRGWPARLTIEGTVEELVIVHEGLQRTDPGGPVPARPK